MVVDGVVDEIGLEVGYGGILFGCYVLLGCVY